MADSTDRTMAEGDPGKEEHDDVQTEMQTPILFLLR